LRIWFFFGGASGKTGRRFFETAPRLLGYNPGMTTQNWWLAGLLIWVAGLGWARAQDAQTFDFTVPQGMVSREFSLGAADLATVEQLCQETLSGGAKFHIFAATRKLRVIAVPEQMETIRQMLPHLTQPGPNVKIEFISRTVNNDSQRGFGVSGGVGGRSGGVVIGGTPGVIRRGSGGPMGGGGVVAVPSGPGGRIGGAIDIDVLNQRTSGSSLNSSFILVQSGKEGFIEVGRDVPMIDYFTRYVADGLYGAVLSFTPDVFGNPNVIVLATGHFEVPQIRWEKEGTRLLVQPVVEGNLVHLTVMPQISAITIVDPEVFRQRGLNTYLTGRNQYVTYMDLATTVTVQSGQEVTIGGLDKAEPEFTRYFFGSAASNATSTGSFTIRATIQ
jgi:type II secretory pathway component GspD/PulD (secretin)